MEFYVHVLKYSFSIIWNLEKYYILELEHTWHCTYQQGNEENIHLKGSGGQGNETKN